MVVALLLLLLLLLLVNGEYDDDEPAELLPLGESIRCDCCIVPYCAILLLDDCACDCCWKHDCMRCCIKALATAACCSALAPSPLAA